MAIDLQSLMRAGLLGAQQQPGAAGLLGMSTTGQAGGLLGGQPAATGAARWMTGSPLSMPAINAAPLQTYAPPALPTMASRVADARAALAAAQQPATGAAGGAAQDPLAGLGGPGVADPGAPGTTAGTTGTTAPGGGTVSTGIGGVSLSPEGQVTANTTGLTNGQASAAGGLLGLMTLGPFGLGLGSNGGKNLNESLNAGATNAGASLTAALSDTTNSANGAPTSAPTATAGPGGTGGQAAAAAAAAAAQAAAMGHDAAGQAAAAQAAADAVVAGQAPPSISAPSQGDSSAATAAAPVADLGSIAGAPSTDVSFGSMTAGLDDGSAAAGGGGGAAGCYLTTAACAVFGLPDDCHELQTLRGWRDRVMTSTPSGRADLAAYYRDAPAIVAGINARPDARSVWAAMWTDYIQPAVAAIHEGDDDAARDLYTRGARWAAQHARA